MEKVKSVLCLGNQTCATDDSARDWAHRLGLPFVGLIDKTPGSKINGVYHLDLGALDMDAVWDHAECSDLVIMLDQSPESYDCIDGYRHLVILSLYLSHCKPVFFDGQNTPTNWIIDINDNQKILDHVMRTDLDNLVIRFNPVNDIDLFQQQVNDIDKFLQAKQRRWIAYRASRHEESHFEATKILLSKPQFVLLRPSTFAGDVQNNIQQQIYHHWINLYLRQGNNENS